MQAIASSPVAAQHRRPAHQLPGAAVDDGVQASPSHAGRSRPWPVSACHSSSGRVTRKNPGRRRRSALGGRPQRRATTAGRYPTATTARDRATRWLTPSPASVPRHHPSRRSCGPRPARAGRPSARSPRRPASTISAFCCGVNCRYLRCSLNQPSRDWGATMIPSRRAQGTVNAAPGSSSTPYQGPRQPPCCHTTGPPPLHHGFRPAHQLGVGASARLRGAPRMGL